MQDGRSTPVGRPICRSERVPALAEQHSPFALLATSDKRVDGAARLEFHGVYLPTSRLAREVGTLASHGETPGLFITGTDTEVGKTVASCAIAGALRQGGRRVGVCKPIASGCRADRNGLVSPDAEALAHFADCRFPLAVINPIRYQAPLAPAMAAAQTKRPFDFTAITNALDQLAAEHDVLLVEGVGGMMVPLDEKRTVVDLARMVGYPVLVVARAGLGTLNHTALTCQAIRAAGLPLAGIVVNRFDNDDPDPSVSGNLQWLAKQNQTRVLAVLPDAGPTRPERGRIHADVLAAAKQTDWMAICRTARSDALARPGGR